MQTTFDSWTAEHLATQTGKTVLITGANSGIGYFTALALARAGAHVVMAGRDPDRIDAAVDRITRQGVKGRVTPLIGDMASLESVQAMAQAFARDHARLDVLINNAGVMMPPPSRTADGFESQFGVNVIAAFALTGHLYGTLKTTPGARVVTLSSVAHRGAQIDFDNLRLEKPYDPRREYYQSKLADLVFALELGRRAEAAGDGVLSVACHPGFTSTELQRHVDPAKLAGMTFMDTWQGSLPTLMAATSPDARQGDYFGPDGPGELGGFPALGVIDDAALDPAVAKRLWQVAEQATGVAYA